MLPVLRLDTRMFCCWHWREFPPNVAHMEGDPEQIWREGRISPTDFQRYQTWKEKCGKKLMDEFCLSCDFVRRLDYRNHLPVMMTLDEKQIIPITDSSTFDSFPRYRGNLTAGIEKLRRK